MGEMKPTKGPWTVDGENAIEPDVMSGEFFVAQCFGFEDGGEALDNARLIAEAGTVFHTTGLSPVQLVEQRDELLAMLHGVLQMDRGSSGRIIIEGWKEEVLRAALAKCEGVGNDR